MIKMTNRPHRDEVQCVWHWAIPRRASGKEGG